MYTPEELKTKLGEEAFDKIRAIAIEHALTSVSTYPELETPNAFIALCSNFCAGFGFGLNVGDDAKK